MCSRLNQFASIPALAVAGKELKIERRKMKKEEDKKAEIQVFNNICPTDYADVLTLQAGEVGIERMRFGLVPAWAKGSKKEVVKKFGLTFNARCESIFELASYRQPILSQRCLVPVRGWHEWPERTTPYFIHRSDHEPLLLAGIWDMWESPYPEDFEDGPVITSMSVVTTPPGPYMAKFHDRSPLILEGENALSWLQPEMQVDDLRAFFKPYDSEQLEAYRVSTSASQVRNKTEEVVRPIAPPVPHHGPYESAPLDRAVDADSQPMLPGLLSEPSRGG
ncbi:SOS response-associated peptidase [Prosthecobacter vanneervenii]|uniref:Abasic site processing protein n=1 Tax=Prosthecobacter vanneervenii TaxID=48466 RepID=A0A7W7Y6K6_9BACT|nr:SOS response-associated peptidase [Prosthecobacter vanneervenii]MBB5030532.1 putative SOS response-associated peptidase YedK [Prosthecobacter vanneervenii]